MRLNSVLSTAFAGCALCLAPAAPAQVPQAIPYLRTMDLLVVDSTFDGVWRLCDFNQDGDYDDAGEVTPFYSDTIGSIALGNPSCVVCAPDGTTYVGDSTNDIVLALRDQNGDGDANDAGEHRVFFTSVANAGGITMASVQGITVDAIGRLFLAVANTGTSGADLVIQLFDLDGDGDANDTGEALDYCTIPGGSGAAGNSIPTKVVAAPDGNLYYAEVGSTGVVTKGVWQLRDVNFDGDCNDAGEVNLFWTPPFTASPQYWSLAVDRLGAFYVTDHSANRQVWRGVDTDSSGTITAGEQTLFYQTASSIWWDVVLRDDGVVLLVDASTPDHVTALHDMNGDGDAFDAGESSQAYSAALASIAIAPRGAALARAPWLVLSPPVVSLGSTTTFVTSASKPGDLVIAVLSLGLAPPAPLPPWGTLEIDPSLFVVVGFGIADAGGTFVQPLAIPNVPTAINTYGCQSLAGDTSRLFLSNGALLTVQ